MHWLMPKPVHALRCRYLVEQIINEDERNLEFTIINLGKWYEIARKDFKHERGLNNVTANYSINDNGAIKVDNQGYDPKKGEWQQAIGKAKFVKDENTAMLKVSFFGPFYAGYSVIAVDDQYKYALVAAQRLKYLWTLSRETDVPENIKENYLKIAQDIGYNTSDLVWVVHDRER